MMHVPNKEIAGIIALKGVFALRIAKSKCEAKLRGFQKCQLLTGVTIQSDPTSSLPSNVLLFSLIVRNRSGSPVGVALRLLSMASGSLSIAADHKASAGQSCALIGRWMLTFGMTLNLIERLQNSVLAASLAEGEGGSKEKQARVCPRQILNSPTHVLESPFTIMSTEKVAVTDLPGQADARNWGL